MEESILFSHLYKHMVVTALSAKTTTISFQALIFIDISEMAKKWQKVASFKRKISSPRADECADFNACSTSSVVEKGHFFVYTSDGKRFMVPLAYLDNNIFKELLKISEEEFGLPGDGPITLPCDAVAVKQTATVKFAAVQVKKRMGRKWQIAAALGRRRISPEKTDASSDSEACTPTTTSVAHKGHFIVYTSDGKRFMVPLEYLDTRIFQELLRMSEEEYGLPGDGPITLHCDAVSMEYILLLLKKQVSKDVEKALLSSILVPHQSSCSSLAIVHNQQLALCSF
ncbi:hypothetical protein J5N97_001878 [Dioscorea zingiberensis]|uniref:Uncharacterized protein n=1 Tax=Dioscorea zingiberensis TaxID=325984 RepID=A0A9D5BT26_9LILI|nr:hypothetical protein J5N97_001878 [Dioscorea zingiberensis]